MKLTVQKIINLHKPDYLVISSNDDPIVFTKKMIEIFLHNRTLRHILVHNQLFFDRESLGLTNVDGEKTYVSESSDGYMISKKIYVSQNLN